MPTFGPAPFLTARARLGCSNFSIRDCAAREKVGKFACVKFSTNTEKVTRTHARTLTHTYTQTTTAQTPTLWELFFLGVLQNRPTFGNSGRMFGQAEIPQTAGKIEHVNARTHELTVENRSEKL